MGSGAQEKIENLRACESRNKRFAHAQLGASSALSALDVDEAGTCLETERRMQAGRLHQSFEDRVRK